MSGCSDSSVCPVCGHAMDVYTDYKPTETVSLTCLHCGFEGYTVYGMAAQDEVEFQLDGEPCEPLSDQQRQQYLQEFASIFGRLPPDEESAYLGRPGSDKPTARVSVRGGVAYLDYCPPGMEVEIIDYDNREES